MSHDATDDETKTNQLAPSHLARQGARKVSLLASLTDPLYEVGRLRAAPELLKLGEHSRQQLVLRPQQELDRAEPLHHVLQYVVHFARRLNTAPFDGVSVPLKARASTPARTPTDSLATWRVVVLATQTIRTRPGPQASRTCVIMLSC